MKKLAGLSWPESGNPAFLCVVVEKYEDHEKTLEELTKKLNVTYELESPSIYDIFEEIKKQKHLSAVYAPTDTKYQSFIREYYLWRREQGCVIPVRHPNISSFEAGVLKLKNYITKKEISFNDNSIVKAQLKAFSKLSLKNENDFFAVSALTNVINSFGARTMTMREDEPDIRGWY
jgi:hypothetical protein